MPLGGGVHAFDAITNPIEIFDWSALFGWAGTGSGKLTWAYTPGADNGLAGDVTFTTQLTGGSKKSSSVFDADPSAGTQTHTASFKKGDVGTGFWEAYVQWTSNNGDRETLLGLQFRDTSVIGAYSSGESFQQNKTADVPVWEP